MSFGKSAIITWLWVNKWHKVYGKISIMAMGNSVHNGYGKIRGIMAMGKSGHNGYEKIRA